MPGLFELLKKTMWWTVAGATIVIPIFVSTSGSDAFRAPKDVLLAAVALILSVLGVAAAAASPRFRVARRRVPPLILVTLAAIVWTAICALFATNRALAMQSLLVAVMVAIFTLVAWWLAAARTIRSAYVIAIPAAINAIVFLSQRFGIWDPLRVDPTLPEHFRYSALVGNPNDVGSFFVAPALAVVTLAVVDVRRRWTWSALAVLVLAAVATGSLTAIVACIVGLFALAVIASGRAAVKAGAAVLLLTIMTVMAFAPLRERLTRIRTLIASGDYAEAFSGRVTPFLAAGEMLTKHPVTGVGPGCFAYEYFPYKVAVEQKHPRLLQVYAHHFNFGQAHNDHLQILAECGVVGYLIALAVLVIIARGSLGQREDAARPTAEFSRHLSLPLAAALATLCVAHFPLHLTAATVAFAFVAALCAAWSEPARVPQGAGLPHAPRAVPKLLRYAVVAASVAVAIPAFNRLVVAPYRCNIAKPRIQRTTMQVFDSSSFAREPTARANIALLRGFLETRRSDVDLYMLLAANERILARNEDAIATYTRALAFDKRPEIYYNIGMLHLGNGRRGEAITNLYQAVLFDRTFMDDVPYEDVKAELAAILARATNSTTTATGS